MSFVTFSSDICHFFFSEPLAGARWQSKKPRRSLRGWGLRWGMYQALIAVLIAASRSEYSSKALSSG